MKKKILVRRYGQGLINALKDEADFLKVREELAGAAAHFFGHGELREVMASPFVVKSKKTAIVKDILERSRYSQRTRNFLLLLLDKGRFELLPDILEILPLLWNDKTGAVTVDVFSAVPLTEPQRDKLRQALESLEGCPVFLRFTLNPALIGGLELRKGHVIYDLSLRGNLMRLRNILAEQ